MVRLAQIYNKGSQSTNSPQNGITAANLFSDDYKQLDLSTRFEIGKMLGSSLDLQLSFDITNLSESKQRSYFQFSNAAFTVYDPGRSYVLGLRAKF